MRPEGPLLRGMGERDSRKASSATVFHYSCALAQGDWCSRPALTCGQVCCLRNLRVLDPGQMFYDVLAVGIPCIDAVSEMGAIIYRHFSFPQSSSASRLTAGAVGILALDPMARAAGPI